MNWTEAVAAMKAGHHVHRASQQQRKLIGHSDGVPMYDCGTEATRLAAAWTEEGKPVMVFQGASSKAMFAPEDDDMAATDWEIAQ
jgi:hypothetical protein